ncbi:MAG: tetratricopeptide repeat protein, partial [Myxococcales bacterium]
LESCERELDPARLWEYRGRVDAAAGRPDRAADAFLKAVEQNGARIAPRLNAAALLMKAGERDRAYKVMRDALELDSASVSEQRRPVSDYFEAPVDGIRLAAGLFEADLSGDDALLRQTYGAIVQYHLGNVDGAARKLDAVLDNDPSSLGALLYRAQIELDRRQYDKALRFAQRAAASDTQASASLYLQGRAYEGLKKRDEAWKRYAQVLGLEPNHLGANLRLAQFAAAEGKDDEAKERLTKVVSVEPEHMEARTELFRLGY